MLRHRRIQRTARVLCALGLIGFGIASGCGQADQEKATGPSVALAPEVTSCLANQAKDGSGTILTFANRLVDPVAGTFTLESTIHQASSSSTTIVELDGHPLYRMAMSAAPGGTATTTETYFAPIGGVHEVVTTSDGKTLSSVMDGRRTVAAPIGTDPAQIRFEDGQPAPAATMSAPIRAGLQRVLEAAGKDSVACLPGATAVQTFSNEAPQELGHPSRSSGSACTGCELGCYGEQFACVAVAAACGFLAPVCALGCLGHTQSCLSGCHKSGTDCCPVGCGGEGEITTPIGGCCLQGEICLRRATSAHVALCCSAGTTVCGTDSCCHSGEACIPAGGGLPAYCCPSGSMRNGHCCSSGVCSSRADCNGGDPFGPNGCDVSGCCFPG